MGYIDRENIVGFNLNDGRVKCANCMSNEEFNDFIARDDLSENCIITKEEAENNEGLYFCDFCNKQL